MRWFPVRLALLFVLASPATWSEDVPTFVQFGTEILVELGGETVDCDSSQTGRYENHIAVRCGTTEESFKAIRKAWRKANRKGKFASFLAWSGDPWRRTTAMERTVYAIFHATPIAVSFDLNDGAIAVRWPESQPSCHTGKEFVWMHQVEDGLAYSRRNRERPDYPEQARVHRSGGAVMGSILVDERGAVTDVCVTGVFPPNMGFEQASIDAIKASTYEPPTLDRDPITIAASFFDQFYIPPGRSPTSMLAQEYFERSRTAPHPDRLLALQF